MATPPAQATSLARPSPDDRPNYGGIDPADVLGDEAIELIGQTTPDPNCTSPTSATPPDYENYVPLDVVRVVGTCFSVDVVWVHVDRVEDRKKELEADPTVIATSVSPIPSIN